MEKKKKKGQFDIDFRIIISTREGAVCILRKGWLEGKSIFRIDYPAVGLSLLPIDQTIIVVCMNNTLDCYSKKGKRLWGVILPASAVCMVSITLAHIGQTLVCVALYGGLVQIYSNKVVVDQFSVPGEVDKSNLKNIICVCITLFAFLETVSAMAFGRLGQEDHVLVLITIGIFIIQMENIKSFDKFEFLEGSLIIKILKRTAEFTIETVDFLEKHSDRSGTLQIPKKTKVFVEQTIRERENAPGIATN